jgi:hypothetical protein
VVGGIAGLPELSRPRRARRGQAQQWDRRTDTRACFHASSGNSRGGEILVARQSRGKGVREADVRQSPTQRPVTEEGTECRLDGASCRQRLQFPWQWQWSTRATLFVPFVLDTLRCRAGFSPQKLFHSVIDKTHFVLRWRRSGLVGAWVGGSVGVPASHAFRLCSLGGLKHSDLKD